MSPLAKIEKILCAIDYSEISRDTLAEAVEVAQRCQAELLVLHVINTRRFEALERVGGRVGGELAEVAEKAIDEYQEKRAKELAELLVDVDAARVNHRSRVTMGIPYERILELAEENNVQMIVMGARGRGSAKRPLRFGSTAEKVFRRAQCRTLFLR